MRVFDVGQPRTRGPDPYPYPWEAPYPFEWLLFLVVMVVCVTEFVLGVFGRAAGWAGDRPRSAPAAAA